MAGVVGTGRVAADKTGGARRRERPKLFRGPSGRRGLRAVVWRQLRGRAGPRPPSRAGLAIDYPPTTRPWPGWSHEAIYHVGLRPAGIHPWPRALISLRTGRTVGKGGRRPPPQPRNPGAPPTFERAYPSRFEGPGGARATGRETVATWEVARGEWLYRLEARLLRGVTRSSVEMDRPPPWRASWVTVGVAKPREEAESRFLVSNPGDGGRGEDRNG